MKKIIGLLFAILLLNTNLRAQWIESSPINNSPRELSYPAQDTAYITGAIGELYQTLDGGETWSVIQNFGGFSSLHSPEFINGTTGFVSANGGVYRTTDAGQSWDTISADWINQTGLPFREITIGDNAIYSSYTINGSTQVIRSTDLGDNWVNLVVLPIAPWDLKMDLWDDLYGAIIDPQETGKYYYSTDGFATVDTVFLQSGQELHQGGNFVMVNSALGLNFGEMFNQDQAQRMSVSGGNIYDLNVDGFNILPVLDIDQRSGHLIASSYFGKFFICYSTAATQWTEYNIGVDAPIYAIDFNGFENAIAIVGEKVMYIKNATTLSLEESEKISFDVFPNPFTDELSIQSDLKNQSYEVYDIQGNLVHTILQEGRIDLSFLAPGTYILETNDGEHILRKKVIKQ